MKTQNFLMRSLWSVANKMARAWHAAEFPGLRAPPPRAPLIVTHTGTRHTLRPGLGQCKAKSLKRGQTRTSLRSHFPNLHSGEPAMVSAADRSTNPRDYVLGNETFESKGGHVGETERSLLTTDQKVVRAANLETQLQKVHSAGLGIRMNSEFVVSC